MGAWNGWSSPTECVKGSDGKWSATIKLEPGTYEYKFRKDGDYDALNKDNRKIVIGADGKEVKGNSSNAGIGSVASIQIPLEADFTKSNTFMTSDEKVMFGYIDPFANSVSIGSDFNGWDPSKTKLIRNVDGIWVATANIKEGRYGWKFVIDGQWENKRKEYLEQTKEIKTQLKDLVGLTLKNAEKKPTPKNILALLRSIQAYESYGGIQPSFEDATEKKGDKEKFSPETIETIKAMYGLKA